MLYVELLGFQAKLLPYLVRDQMGPWKQMLILFKRRCFKVPYILAYKPRYVKWSYSTVIETEMKKNRTQ